MVDGFTAPDMEYIRKMKFDTYEVFDLNKDISQQKNIIDEIEDAQFLKQKLDEQLSNIQRNGYYWKDLPPAQDRKKMKKDWVKID